MLWCSVNLSVGAAHTLPGQRAARAAISGLKSDQQEIDQRDQGGPDAGGDQEVIGTDVAVRIERRLAWFLAHFGGLGQAGPAFCERDHIRRSFFEGTTIFGNSWRTPGLIPARALAGLTDRKPGNASTSPASPGQSMAIRRRRKRLAVDADRHDGAGFSGTGRSPRCARDALRSQGFVRVTLAAGVAGLTLSALAVAAGLRFQPAELEQQPPTYPPAICSRGRLPRSMPRSLASSRPI